MSRSASQYRAQAPKAAEPGTLAAKARPGLGSVGVQYLREMVIHGVFMC